MIHGIARRGVVALLGATALWPCAAAAQPSDRERALVNRILRMHAEDSARSVRQAIGEVEVHMGWTVQRLAQDVVASKTDYSNAPKFTDAVAKRVYYGPLYYREAGPATARVAEPSMTLSVSGSRRDAGVSVAELNLKLFIDVVGRMKLGARDIVYILDRDGALFAHPSAVLVVNKADMTRLAHVQSARAASPGATAPVTVSRDYNGRAVLATHAAIPGLGWLMIVEVPVEEANALAQ